MIANYIKLLRIPHWIKNLLIFLPAFFGGVIQNKTNMITLFSVFFYFSFAASFIYILNDYKDLNKDKLHFKKRSRPLASGIISKKMALLVMGFIVAFLFFTSLYLPIKAVYVTCIYIVLNILYSFKLKSIPILELFIISIGFVFRILIGGFSIGVELSKWIVILTFFMALYIILSKRRGEILNDNALHTREVLKEYSIEFLTYAMVMVLSISIVAYIMYTLDPNVIKHFSIDKIYITSIFVILALLRHLQQTIVYNNTESPVSYLFKDRFMIFTIISWLFTYYYIIYIL